MTATVKSTTDYEIFKKHPSNRELEKCSLDRLKKSIKTRNLLFMRPIILDKEMRVIDGQHRLQVAKDLGLPIYYTISEKIADEDMVLLNTQTTWSIENYLNYWVSQGNRNYILFKQMMDKHEIRLRSAMKLFASDGGKTYHNFKAGKFVFPEGERLKEATDILRNIEEIANFIVTKTTGNKLATKSVAFNYSLVLFFNIKSIDFEAFMKRLSICLDRFHPCTKVLTYMTIWKDIYNYHNRRDAITTEELTQTL